MPTPKELLSLHQLLHLTHHRNKNQHRLSKWYKPFSILRRQISKLISELETLETAELYACKGEKGGENKYVMAAREKAEARVKFLREWVLEDCFLAFSNLVADNQYSALGLVLLGCLAQVKSVIGQLVEDEGLDGGIVEAEVDEGESMVREVEVADDFGEVVSREEVLGNGKESRDEVDEEGKDEQGQLGEQVQEETGEEAQEMTMARSGKKKRTGPRIDDTRLAEEILTPSKPPKKKRKKGDAFDDLFSGLI